MRSATVHIHSCSRAMLVLLRSVIILIARGLVGTEKPCGCSVEPHN